MENVVHHAPLAIYCVDNSGIVTLWNKAAEELFGFGEKEIIGQRDLSIPHEESQQLCMDVFHDTRGKVVKRKCKQGYTLDVMIWTSPLMDDSGNIIGRTVMAAKASEANIVHDLEKTRSIVDRILETVDINIWSNDLLNQVGSYSSKGSSKIFGYSHEMFEKDPMLWRKLVHPDDADYVDSLDYSGPVPVKAEFRIIRKDGETRWVAASVYPQFDQHGVPVRFEGITVDITEHKEFQRKLHEFAYTDFLTNLPNRHKFDMDFAQAIEEARVSEEHVGLLYIDFDRFKYINDTFGHQAGDFALQQIANKFHCTLPKTVNVYRMGGDEFTVLVRHVKDEHALETLAASILSQYDALPFGKEEVPLHCSIGIALYPLSGENTDLLLRASDMAMYCAKEEGGNQYRVCPRDAAL